MDDLMVHIVDDDEALRDSTQALVARAGFRTATYASASDFLSGKLEAGCALVDVRMPEMDGIALMHEMTSRRIEMPVIVMTGFADVPLAVKAMKAGANDFVEKPCPREELIAAIKRALSRARSSQAEDVEKKEIQTRLARLTQRERDVLQLIVLGDANKVIAHKLGISPRTVEIHRGRLMEKTEAGSLAELVRMAISAGIEGPASG
ncbi:MAG: response regulator [Alphaproteobacteria bacterium]|nr:response regulator [Alphaproteobacteria bacterium]